MISEGSRMPDGAQTVTDEDIRMEGVMSWQRRKASATCPPMRSAAGRRAHEIAAATHNRK